MRRFNFFEKLHNAKNIDSYETELRKISVYLGQLSQIDFDSLADNYSIFKKAADGYTQLATIVHSDLANLFNYLTGNLSIEDINPALCTCVYDMNKYNDEAKLEKDLASIAASYKNVYNLITNASVAQQCTQINRLINYKDDHVKEPTYLALKLSRVLTRTEALEDMSLSKLLHIYTSADGEIVVSNDNVYDIPFIPEPNGNVLLINGKIKILQRQPNYYSIVNENYVDYNQPIKLNVMYINTPTTITVEDVINFLLLQSYAINTGIPLVYCGVIDDKYIEKRLSFYDDFALDLDLFSLKAYYGYLLYIYTLAFEIPTNLNKLNIKNLRNKIGNNKTQAAYDIVYTIIKDKIYPEEII